jgi:hypothetical protein
MVEKNGHLRIDVYGTMEISTEELAQCIFLTSVLKTFKTA